MKRGLVLLHGLPGVGKSTLARGLANRLPGFFYADMATHPDFRSKPMFKLCAELYDSDGLGRSLITEGVLSSASYRDAFVDKLIQHAAENNVAFEWVAIVKLVADIAVLVTRRNRSLADYEKLAFTVEGGSDRFPYHTLKVAESGAQSLQDDIERLAAIIEDYQSSKTAN